MLPAALLTPHPGLLIAKEGYPHGIMDRPIVPPKQELLLSEVPLTAPQVSAFIWRQGADTVTLVRPTIQIDTLEEQSSLANAYSKLKLGHYDEIVRGGIDVVSALTPSMCHAIATRPSDWCVLSIGTYRGFGLPSAAVLLARECAERLGLAHVMLGLSGSDRSRVSSPRYEELSSKEERLSILQQEIAGATLPDLMGKHVLLCDDSLASGTFVELVAACARAHGAKSVSPYVLHRFDGHGDHSFEQQVNTSSFVRDPIPVFRELLTDSKTAFTTRLVVYCLSLAADELRALLVTIPEFGRINLTAAALVFYGDALPGSARAVLNEIEPEIMRRVSLSPDFGECCKRSVGNLLASRMWRNGALSREALIESITGV
jgi:hypothetical protein